MPTYTKPNLEPRQQRRRKVFKHPVAIKLHMESEHYEQLIAFAYDRGMSFSAFAIGVLDKWCQLQTEKEAQDRTDALIRLRAGK